MEIFKEMIPSQPFKFNCWVTWIGLPDHLIDHIWLFSFGGIRNQRCTCIDHNFEQLKQSVQQEVAVLQQDPPSDRQLSCWTPSKQCIRNSWAVGAQFSDVIFKPNKIFNLYRNLLYSKLEKLTHFFNLIVYFIYKICQVFLCTQCTPNWLRLVQFLQLLICLLIAGLQVLKSELRKLGEGGTTT